MYCKDCKHKKPQDGMNPAECTSDKLLEMSLYMKDPYRREGDRLLYSYEEGGRFYVEDYFGCVHFAPCEVGG